MKKKIILVLILTTLVASLSATEGIKPLSHKFRANIGVGYSPSFSFTKDEGNQITSFNNSLIINNEMYFEGINIGLNIGVNGTFPFMTQVKKDKYVTNTSNLGTFQDGIVGVSIAPIFTIYKNDIADVKLAIGGKYSAEFFTDPSKIKVDQKVGADLDVMARILGNHYINFLVGIKQSLNFFHFGSIQTVSGKETFSGSQLSYEVMPYIGVNLKF